MVIRTLLCCLLAVISSVHGDLKLRSFPSDFLFGAATSAYQIEGGWMDGGKTLSIWDVATHTKPSPIKDESTGDIAADSYRHYVRDVEIMKDLGLNFYRFSISWTRILPDGFSVRINHEGVDYYNKLIDEMLKYNIKPFVTMYHWDLPAVLQQYGGWTNPNIVVWFTDYAKVLLDNFGDRVPYWITINEPKQICYEGYGSDLKAPMMNFSGIADYLCAKHVLLAHASVYRMYDEHYRKVMQGQVGIAISFTWFEPSSTSMDDHQAVQDAKLFDWGIYSHPIFSKTGDFPQEVKRNVGVKSAEQNFPRSRIQEFTHKEIAYIRGTADFLGVNHYTSKMTYRDASLDGLYPVPSMLDDMGAAFDKDHSWPQAQSSWLYEVPKGFKKLLVEIKNIYGNPPVFITENGWSTKGGLLDDDRIRYYRKYLNALLDALDEGCDVQAFTAWSLIDNFEWKQGYTEKFGLYQVDFYHPERTRTPRKSAFVYKEIIRSKKLDPNYEPESYFIEATDRSVKIKETNEDVF